MKRAIEIAQQGVDNNKDGSFCAIMMENGKLLPIVIIKLPQKMIPLLTLKFLLSEKLVKK